MKDHRIPELDKANAEKTTLAKLKTDLDKNALRFEKNYGGKTVNFDTEVISIAYQARTKSTRLVFKSLTGNHVSGCSLRGPMEDKAIDLDKGQTITLTATVTVYTGLVTAPNLEFESCQF